MSCNFNEIVPGPEAHTFYTIENVDKSSCVGTIRNNYTENSLIDMDNTSITDMTDDEKIDFVAQRILKRYKSAFEELAK